MAMAGESHEPLGKTPQVMMPLPETRLAVSESIYQQYQHFNMDQLLSSPWIPVSGGSINQSYRVNLGANTLFIKLHQPQSMPMFEAEVEGLRALHDTGAIRVPKVYAYGHDSCHSWLVMEYIQLSSHNSVSEKIFAQQLAKMHRCEDESFGWFRNNTIGSTVQINTANTDWIDFYREQRLGYQLKLAKNNGFSSGLQAKGERLLADLDVFFIGYEAQASLLHGDLWSGNHAVDTHGEPVIFDPAVYYGDREADIAMTELFGGLSRDFYTAYDEAYPLAVGYQVRKNLYNLYHILNHANLFTGSYVRQAESMIDQLLAEHETHIDLR